MSSTFFDDVVGVIKHICHQNWHDIFTFTDLFKTRNTGYSSVTT